jgi:3-isopropylmalate dehydratase small subunit
VRRTSKYAATTKNEENAADERFSAACQESEMISNLRGRVWKFGDHIDTDVMTSGKYLNLPMEEMKSHVFEAIRPDFAQEVKPGDILIAGRNFGCGSSRETAPAALKTLGIGAVVAESFARIFYRNAIAIGLPAIICPRVGELLNDGDEAEVSFTDGRIINGVSKKSFPFAPFPDEMLRILECGGIEGLLKQLVKDQ